MMPQATGDSPLRRWEKIGLVCLALLLLGLGTTTVIRSAFLSTPKTDFQVYARAAWAIRNGEDPYWHFDNNGWHYVYPPTFAIFMMPLADPYPFLPRDGYLPFAVSAAIWYVIGVATAAYSVHVLAAVVLPDAVLGSRRWWYARLVPFYVCLGGIGLTVSRGQVNTVLVALIAAGFAAAMRGRRIRSGAWLAAAAVLKVIPAFLMLFPAVRRDGRANAGAAVAVVVLLGVIPAAVMGPQAAIDANWKMIAKVVAPAVADGGDRSRETELTGATATYSQSVQGAVNAWIYPDRGSRPAEFHPLAKRLHWISGAMLVVITLTVAWRRLTPNPADQLLFLGSLCAVMMLLTPISHLHYYAMVLPLVCGLWLRGLARRPGQILADRRTIAVLAAWSLLTSLPLLPGSIFDRLRECGLGTAATIGLWAYGLAAIGSKAVTTLSATIPEPDQPNLRLAA